MEWNSGEIDKSPKAIKAEMHKPKISKVISKGGGGTVSKSHWYNEMQRLIAIKKIAPAIIIQEAILSVIHISRKARNAARNCNKTEAIGMRYSFIIRRVG
jgi:hypothetical protein